MIVDYAQNETIVRQRREDHPDRPRGDHAVRPARRPPGRRPPRRLVPARRAWSSRSSSAGCGGSGASSGTATNALVLIGLIVVGTTLLLKLTAGRPGLPFLLPTAAAGMLLAILLDAGVATIVIALIALIGGAVNGGDDQPARADGLHLPRRAGRDHRDPPRRPAPDLRPGGARGRDRQRPRRRHVRVPRVARRPRRHRADGRLAPRRRGLRGRRCRHRSPFSAASSGS